MADPLFVKPEVTVLQGQCLAGARVDAGAALDALVLVDLGVVLDGQSAHGAGVNTSAAAYAHIGIDVHCHRSSPLLVPTPAGPALS